MSKEDNKEEARSRSRVYGDHWEELFCIFWSLFC